MSADPGDGEARTSRVRRWLLPLLNVRVMWDVFMVWAAVVNLWLIAFDLTYLWLRPAYFHWVPVITRVYDPIKGIEPHPLTEAVLAEVDAVERLLDTNPRSPRLEPRLEELRRLSRRVLLENPFERSGQSRFFVVLKEQFISAARAHETFSPDVYDLTNMVDRYWSGTPAELRAKLERFDSSSRKGFELNYFREFDESGRLTDNFWVIDLPFLALFWAEFGVRWYLALRRRTYAKWFFFPIFNWYDVLGLVPNRYFRVFRLLRAVSIYMRLRRSRLSGVGRDPFSRAVAWLSNVVTEEVSDRVALRILSELHEEISSGTHSRIIRETVEPRRDEIESVVIHQIQRLVSEPETMERFRELLLLNLRNAVERTDAIRSVPLPQSILRPVVRFTGEIVLDTTLETIATTVDSEEGERAIREVASSILDEVFDGPGVAQVEELVKDISLQVIDHIKDVVAVKKWARPDDPHRGPEP